MDKALQTMINNMSEKTGKSLDEWKKILKNNTFNKHSEAVNFLKSQHSVTHGFANTIVTLSKDNSDTADDLVTNQYKGKEQLKPIYKNLVSLVSDFGNDITITPKKATVSLIRKKQFALIKPATKTRIDLGLKLPGVEINNRLENSGPFGAMCTHRVRIEKLSDINSELVSWIKSAYDKAN